MSERASSRGELTEWYLARLRNNARQTSLERKLTPMTLVETDKNLIQEIVASSQPGYEARFSEVLAKVQSANWGIRFAQNALCLMSFIGILIIVVIYLF